MDEQEKLMQEWTRLATDMVFRSLQDIAPGYAQIVEERRETVRPAKNLRLGDLVCHAPVALFRRLLALHGYSALSKTSTEGSRELVDVSVQKHKNSGSQEMVTDDDAKIMKVNPNHDKYELSISTRDKQYETMRVQTFCSEKDVASEIVAGFLPKDLSKFTFVKIRDNGEINFCTSLHFQKQKARSKLPCLECGVFFAASRGLRDHQQIAHSRTYKAALTVVDESKNQICKYVESFDIGSSLMLKIQQDAGFELAQKNAMHEGLCSARDGNLNELKAIVSLGWDGQSVDRHGSNALHYAAGGGHKTVCEYLVNVMGLSVHTVQEKDGRHALHWASRNGHLNIVEWILEEYKVDPNVATKDGTTSFRWAAWQGHLHVCKYLFAKGADAEHVNSYGCTAIHGATQNDNLELCTWLLQIGCNFRRKNNNGHTGFHKAAHYGRRVTVIWLLRNIKYEPEDFHPDHDGNTPQQLARHNGHKQLADELSEIELRLKTSSAVTGSNGSG
eukprot:m.105017 g.105017  ORF g.105017 m.105017 type:complete len:502 (+) comp13865_c0_seq4:217-1722(+)